MYHPAPLLQGSEWRGLQLSAPTGSASAAETCLNRSHILFREPTSVILASEISWTEEPGRLQPIGLQESDTTDQLSTHAKGGAEGKGRVWVSAGP